MTDVDFVPTKPHPPGKFALQRVPWAGHDLARKALSLVSPSTRITSPPPEDRSRLWQRENHSANSWQNASNLALVLVAKFHFARSLRGSFTIHGELQR
ncbi:hypothetical protein [Nitrosococcus oceani]|uniref:Uncharacterized protein n=1 Tax=Nitrosococcus oceani C-27 TaxID=314279 RepID=A0A0E2YZL1_9GAMM|nr:hypothetical protein [Nitrosococcus oceani]KFI18793.1 hypothetical protein IB75_12070 [Nitrosococcus oceani C-27]